MSFRIKKNTIFLTRGDTFRAKVNIVRSNGAPYMPKPNDTIQFAMKKDCSDDTPLVVKNIPVSSMILHIEPSDTKGLEFGSYRYDIQLTTANGDVDTFITNSIIKITEEVG